MSNVVVIACKRCNATGSMPLPSLGAPKSHPCPYCKGVGLVAAPTSSQLEEER